MDLPADHMGALSAGARLAKNLLRPSIGLRAMCDRESLLDVPHPSDDPRVHASGVDSDRVLIFGGADAIGWGVLSHDLGLPGMLARALSYLTGRGTDADVLTGPGASAATAISELAGVNLWRYDAVMLTLGTIEAEQLSSVERWVTDLEAVLEFLVRHGMPGVQVFVVAVRPRVPHGTFSRVSRSIESTHRRSLNQASARIAGRRPHVTFVTCGDAGAPATSAGYRETATRLAQQMRAGLDSHFSAYGSPAFRNGLAASADEGERQLAVEALHLTDRQGTDALDSVVALTRVAFGTRSAALSIVGRDRTWAKSLLGSRWLEAPRSVSICSTTILQASALVIADASHDDRFLTAELQAQPDPIRFYAGFPIEAPTGERIGALCVFDPDTRDIRDVDRELLRDFALLAQHEIWMQSAAGHP